MSNTIVQRLQNDSRVIFLDLGREQLILWEKFVIDIADPVQYLGRRQ